MENKKSKRWHKSTESDPIRSWSERGGTTDCSLRRYAVNGLNWLLVFTSSSVITALTLIIFFKSMSWWYEVEHPYVNNKNVDGGFDLAGAGSVFLCYFLIVFFIWILSTWISYKVLKNIFDRVLYKGSKK